MEFPKPQKPEPTPPARIPRKIAVHTRSRGPKSVLAVRADVLWSLIIRRRAGRRCEVPLMVDRCPMDATEAAHCLGKGPFPHVRYDLSNGIAMCHSHHLSFGSATLIGISPMRTLMIQLRGRVAWDRLAKLCLESSWTDLKLIVKDLRAEEKKLGRDDQG